MLAGALGAAVGLSLPTFYAGGEVVRMVHLLLLQLACAALSSGAALLYFPSKPPRPPTAVVGADTDAFAGGFPWAELGRVARMPSFFWLLIGNAASSGVFTTTGAVMGQLMKASGFEDPALTGLAATTSMLAGLVGAAVMSRVVDATKAYKATLVGLNIVLLLGFILIGEFAMQPATYGVMVAILAICGVSVVSVTPIALEAAVELSYPLPAPVVALLVFVSTQVVALATTSAAAYILGDHAGPDDARNTMRMMSAVILVGPVAFGLYKQRRVRSELEQSAASASVGRDYSDEEFM